MADQFAALGESRGFEPLQQEQIADLVPKIDIRWAATEGPAAILAATGSP